MPNLSNESKISEIIRTIRTWSLLWNLEDLQNEIIKSSAKLLKADFAYLLLLETSGLKEKARWTTPNISPHNYLLEIAEKVIRHGSAVYAHDLVQGEYRDAQVYCVPMTANRGVLGVIYLEIINRKAEITADEKLLLEMLGLQAASFLENSILYHSAITDPLTGLYSHRHFQQECDQIMRRAIRTQSCVTLMILDLDHFKQLNDKFGHEEGNKCLKKISDILKTSFRATDIIARFGGDEFEILLPDATTEKCEKIAQALIEVIYKENFPLQISGTIGIATYPTHAIDSQSLFLAADQALYVGKKKGRNCIAVSTQTKPEIKDAVKKLDSLKNLQLIPPKSGSIKMPNKFKKDIQRIDGLDIIGRIASSSNGEVLLAKQNELDREVALKRPLTSHLSEEQSAAFRKEALITASLSHPGVVPLYTMGQGVDGRLYYTMKPLKGFSLEELLLKWKKKDSQIIKEYNLFKIVHILLKASETVAFAHSQNIAHLDIHPGNIIIGEFGEITLIDWGKGVNLNEESVQSSSTGVYVSGSPIYRAPEQLKSGKVGKFTDVYSLGIILYEILTDKTPFKKDSTRDTVEAIIQGIENTSINDEVYQGSDPILSTACKSAISRDYQNRLTSAEFSRYLSRYVMLEAEIITHIFHTPSNPMSMDEWQNIPNSTDEPLEWLLNNGVLSTTKSDIQYILYWKRPITGNFSFTCEGWVTEEEKELSLICFGKSIQDTSGWKDRKELYRGYYFQFGADKNQYTKLARHGDDILVDSNHTVEINRKYTITISYQDGWLHCYIDNNLIFNYRELHPFNGYHIGLYGYGGGSNYRPIDIKYEKKGLLTPAILLADEHLTHNRFDAAISRYEEIIQTFPDRLEGFEALLKKGYCYAKLDNKPVAEEIFNSLNGTILEPYALAERAMMELPNNEYEALRKEGDYKQAYMAFQSLAKKFPGHQALFRILYPCLLLRFYTVSNHFYFKKNRQETLNAKIELFKIGLESLSPPSQSQIRCLGSMITHLIFCGNWDKALTYLTQYTSKYYPYIIKSSLSKADFLHLFYCCNKWDDKENVYSDKLENIHLTDLYPIILLDKFDAKISLFKISEFAISNSWKGISYKIICNIALNNDFSFSKYIEYFSLTTKSKNHLILAMRDLDLLLFEIMLGADNQNKSLNELLNFFSLFSLDELEHSEEANNVKIYLNAIKLLFEFNFQGSYEAITKLKNYNFKISPIQEKKILLTCFFISIGFKLDQDLEEFIKEKDVYLAGQSLELANNLIAGKDFVLSDKWSKKPSYCYFDRLLFCFWLLYKQKFQDLRITLNSLINPKLGSAYFQPQFLKIKEVCEESTKGPN